MRIRRRFHKMGLESAVVPFIDVVCQLILFFFVSIFLNNFTLLHKAEMEQFKSVESSDEMIESSENQNLTSPSWHNEYQSDYIEEYTDVNGAPAYYGEEQDVDAAEEEIAADFVIYVDSNGNISINDNYVPYELFPDAIEAYPVPATKRKDYPIIVNASSLASKGTLSELSDILQSYGYNNISIQVQDEYSE